MGQHAMRAEWFPLVVCWMSERVHVYCCWNMVYNGENHSKNNKTYSMFDFESLEMSDIVAVVLVTLYISRYAYAPVSHVISERA